MTASAVKAAASPTVEAVAAAVESAGITAAIPATVRAPIAISWARVAVTVTIVTAAIITATPVVAASVKTAPIVAVIPGAGTDEEAINEVARAIVAIRGAGIRIIAVVTVGTDRSWPNCSIHGTNSHSDRNLGLRAGCGKEQNAQQS